MMRKFLAAALLLVSGSAAASAGIYITEWMYSGADGEFVEFTNLGAAPIDMTGWSFDDDSAIPGVLDLSPFGVVQPGESVIITESTEAAFRAAWNLPAGVKVIAEFTNNLGRNDEINLFDDQGDIVDRLTYGDQAFPGSIRTQNRSGNPITLAAIGANDPYQWELASIEDVHGSYASFGGDLGNPGLFLIPEPVSIGLLVLAGLVSVRRR